MQSRLKSPVLWGQALTLIAGAIVVLYPNLSDLVKQITLLIVGIYQIFAGVNNPTNSEGL